MYVIVVNQNMNTTIKKGKTLWPPLKKKSFQTVDRKSSSNINQVHRNKFEVTGHGTKVNSAGGTLIGLEANSWERYPVPPPLFSLIFKSKFPKSLAGGGGAWVHLACSFRD